MWDKIVKSLALAFGAVAGFLGEWNVLLTVLACMMVLDYLSGLMVAFAGNSPKSAGGGVSSKVGFQGLMKKGFIIVIVLVATLLDKALGTTAMIFQTAATCYYIANEGISVLENAALMGLPFPAKLKGALETLKQKNDADDGDPPDTTA
jgi:toxin secretion/phage lysis holin